MKALSIRQPWGNLIASGKKTIETRTWPTNHRGPLLVCVGEAIAPGCLDRFPNLTIDQVYAMPRGVALCIVDVVDCRPMVKADEPAACCDIYPRAWAWVLANVRTIDPFPVKGRLGLFDVALDHDCART